jgi:hypothetical protein
MLPLMPSLDAGKRFSIQLPKSLELTEAVVQAIANSPLPAALRR